jgi:hypothetical protein
MVVCFTRQHLKHTYEDLRHEPSLNFSNETLRSILRNVGIINWRSKKRLALTVVYACLCYQFAMAHMNTDWTTVIFLDKCSVEKGVRKQNTWSLRYPREKWDYNKVDEYLKGRQGSITV